MTNVKSTENDKLRGNTEYEIKAQNFSKIVFFFRMSLRYEMKCLMIKKDGYIFITLNQDLPFL